MREPLLLGALILLAEGPLLPQSCPHPNEGTLRTISEAVSTRFDLAPDLGLEDQGTVNGTCYRRLLVRSREPRRTFFLYLSPDERFLTPDLIDLTLRDSEEREREKAETVKLLEADHSPTRGSANSTVTLVEFSDFQCPYCKQLEGYLSRARDEGLQFRVVFKQRPLPQHAWARQAAVLSSCAAQQSNDAFWRVHDLLFERQNSLSVSTLKDSVGQLLSTMNGIDLPTFESCASEDGMNHTLEADERVADEFHVKETPTIFINGSRRVGLISFEDLKASINAAQQDKTTAMVTRRQSTRIIK